MEVAFFTDSYRPYVSGVVNSIDTLKSHLEYRNHDVYIFAPAYPGREGRDRHGGRVFRYASLGAPVYPQYRVPIPLSVSLTATLRRLGVQVIHAHSPFLMGKLGASAARRLGLPLVFTFHTLYDFYFDIYAGPMKDLFRPALLNYLRSFCNQCRLIIAPSGPVAEGIRAMGIHAPVEVVPTGIPLERYEGPPQGDVRARWGIPPDAVLFLYVGRLAAEKDPELLLDAFALAARREAQACLILVGDGPLREALTEKAAALGLAERVRFAGVQPPEAMPDFYKAADVFAFPSRSETQGLVLVEAMAAGLPVAAVDAAATVDVVGDSPGGILTEPTAGALAQAMLAAALTDRPARSLAARERARHFSAGLMARRMEKVYQDLVEAGRRVRPAS
ncbi:MAG TPA: glycosyltransferase [Sphingobacteriaceae bacterium]|nr:glycosyltransferase [Sphingobacteriaceae bacterium]